MSDNRFDALRDATIRALLDELEKATRWIPVSQELPGHGKTVICFSDWGVGEARCYVDFDGKTKFTNLRSGCADHPNVTHWRPLPAPPEPKEGEK